LYAFNTNGHEVLSQVFENGDFLVTANYPEKLGVKERMDAGVQTTDLFLLRKYKRSYRINHLPEPVNSIFTEADGWMAEDQSYILFVSDRSGNIGEYHKKGWKWNDSFWGNTDVYVSLRSGNGWAEPINLGAKINTPYAERTPWLSYDGLTLFLSSNGYINGKKDLDVFAFRRKSLSDWVNWQGPYLVDDANTAYDDWGYKETRNRDAFLASSDKLDFKPTQYLAAGDGGIRETNFRSGYRLYGLQVAALNNEFETNLYYLKKVDKPAYILRDVFFDFDSYTIRENFEKYLLLLIDQINQNDSMVIEINGHTDRRGSVKYNYNLSLKRADVLKDFFIKNGVKNKIITKGYGNQYPLASTSTPSDDAKNRRVEIYFK
jgi:outer membrane protein OmpA-like peptidoglycan-associated protein